MQTRSAEEQISWLNKMKTIDGLPEALLMEYRVRYNTYLKSTPNEKKVAMDSLKEVEKEILKLMYK